MAKGREPLRVPENWRSQDRQFVIQLERILDDVYNGKADAETTKKAIQELVDNKLDAERFGVSKIYTKTTDFPSESSIDDTSTLIDIFAAMEEQSMLFISPSYGGFGSAATLGAKVNGVVLLFKYFNYRNFGFNFYSMQTNATNKEWYTFRFYYSGSAYDQILWSENNDISTALSLWKNFSVSDNMTSLANLITYIKSKSTNDMFIVHCSNSVITDLNGSSVSYAGPAIIFKASANNAYFFFFNRDASGIGNISLTNNNVSVRHSLV